MLRACAAVLVVAVLSLEAAAAGPSPESAAWLFERLAARAAQNAVTAAKAGETADAKTWRAWAGADTTRMPACPKCAA